MNQSTTIQPLLSDHDGPIDGGEGWVARSESELAGIALALGAPRVAGWSATERRLAEESCRVARVVVADVRERIRAGEDPLGQAFCKLRPPAERRLRGATFTPRVIIDAMIQWAAESVAPHRIVDPGTGSGRYLVRAGQRFSKAALVGIEIDPLPAMLARANLAVSGMAKRSSVLVDDYRRVSLPPIVGFTVFLGNPPYVRHHLLDAHWKRWLTSQATRRGYAVSQLAGLHIHFFLATLQHAAPGDFGAFITAAEWLDVNYGSLLRELFLGDLGGTHLVLVEPTAAPFPDAATTAAITCFQVGARPKRIQVRCIRTLDTLLQPNGHCEVARERLEGEKRWSQLTRTAKHRREGYVELGELCRVHRGQVTGLNKVWIAGTHTLGLPLSVLLPTVTRARELFDAGDALDDPSVLRRVVDLPVELDKFDRSQRTAIDRFLAKARLLGADSSYVARNRKAWWSVGLRVPAPILTTYMARRPPAFVHNRVQARHLNIAHGLYPREAFSQAILDRLVMYLRKTVDLAQGRTYAGGLTKFEPKEVERLAVPRPELLETGEYSTVQFGHQFGETPEQRRCRKSRSMAEGFRHTAGRARRRTRRGV